MKDTRPDPIFIQGKKQSKIAVYCYANPSTRFSPVILTHGTFSNALICAQLARFLHDHGFECWIYEWTGHGRSQYGDLCPDVEDFARHDVPIVIQTVLAATNKTSCIWVAHSGGGFLPLIYMARHPGHQHMIEKLVGIGSQTIGAGKTWTGKVITRILPLINQMLGKVPGPLLNLGPEDEASRFLMQWSRWNRSGRWMGKDGFDYDAAMKDIHIPVTLFAGGRDFIAPARGCRQLFESLGSSQKDFLLCSKGTGCLENYNHPRLIASSNARKEIWPVILEFIRS